MKSAKISFGRRLRQLRRERDFTQEQLAEVAEVSVDLVSNIERGVNAPSFETLERLASALSVPIKDLFDFHNAD